MQMIAAERRAAATLAGIYAIRMLGLFLVLPVLALAARHLDGATPTLIGVAIGVYGLTQAGLQIPFGLASDRFGRKAVIVVGLLIFAGGSIVAALAHSIWLLIVGRALQGAGAIASALIALAADLTRDSVRTRVMAMIGISIGMSFSVAMVLGPLINAWFSLADLFWLAAALAVLALAMLLLFVPTPRVSTHHADSLPALSQIREVLADGPLLRLDTGIFLLHLIMTGTFIAAPLALEAAGLPEASHWEVYLPVFGGSVALMGPLVMFAERDEHNKGVFLIGVGLLALAQAVLWVFHGSAVAIGLALLVFFTGFNTMEATLPALISRAAPAGKKGSAMGVYSTSQFLGAFAGGVTAGALNGVGGYPLVFGVLSLAAIGWWVFSLSMPRPRPITSHVVPLAAAQSRDDPDRIARQLSAIVGVEEAVVVPEENVAYIKVDRHRFDRQSLQQAGFGDNEDNQVQASAAHA